MKREAIAQVTGLVVMLVAAALLWTETYIPAFLIGLICIGLYLLIWWGISGRYYPRGSGDHMTQTLPGRNTAQTSELTPWHGQSQTWKTGQAEYDCVTDLRHGRLSAYHRAGCQPPILCDVCLSWVATQQIGVYNVCDKPRCQDIAEASLEAEAPVNEPEVPGLQRVLCDICHDQTATHMLDVLAVCDDPHCATGAEITLAQIESEYQL